MEGRFPDEVAVPSHGVTVRRYTAADVEPLRHAITANLAHLRTFMDWAAHEPLDDDARLALFAEWDREWEADRAVIYGMFAASGDVIGGTGLSRRHADRPDIVEIGYWVHVDLVRRGIATAVAGALTDTAFARPDTTVVEILHHPANVASRGVPAKLGYRCLGDHTRRDLMFTVWQITRPEACVSNSEPLAHDRLHRG